MVPILSEFIEAFLVTDELEGLPVLHKFWGGICNNGIGFCDLASMNFEK